jgi:hypothetical protein
MSIPKNIQKEHLIQAIEKIEREGIPLNGESNYYDVVYNKKFYPPKLIVSIANLFANGQELDRNTFDGGLYTPCFNLLESNGFEIVTKELDEVTSAEELKKYLDHFKDNELIIQFFEFAKNVLSNSGLTERDKRIAFTLRKNKRQISINLGRKLVLGIYKSNTENFFNFYVSENDVKWAKNLPGYFKEEVFNTNPPARLLYFSASHELLQNVELLTKVKKGVDDWLPYVESAGQPERHNRLIYNLIMDPLLRDDFFDKSKASIDFKEQVMIYEVKQGADSQSNAKLLRNEEQGYFYWNDSTFKNLKKGDYVFVVNTTNREVLFSILEENSIQVTKTEKTTSFTDQKRTYTVTGKYDQFVRLKILKKLIPKEQWKWKSLGQPQNTYLAGPNINLKLAENRLINIDQLKELSGESDYQQLLEYCKRCFEKTGHTSDLIPEILEAVKSDFVKEKSLEEEFLFEKARTIFKQILDHNEPKEFYEELFKRFITSKLSFSVFQESVKTEEKVFEFISSVGKAIVYIDYNAANKNTLNEYDDKRTFAKSGVNQSLWFRGFLKLKIAGNNPDGLPKNISNAFKYLINPNDGLTMLSPSHRIKVSKYILGQLSYNESTFVNELKIYFKKYPFKVSNEENFTRIISEILYVFPEVYKIWNPEGSAQVESADYISEFIECAASNNLYFPSYLTKRYVASLATKPFVIFTGLSGSGKTKLAQTFAKWICESEDQYKIIPVGADWTNREPLLGYPNSLDSTNYVLPDNGALALVIDAIDEAKGKDLKDCKPYFLILDEMNLSHVERYFADFLSAMESKEPISLYKGETRTDSNGKEIPQQIVLPQNLFIVGTVNIDETTYMFSPKVLDRANTMEFRLDESDIRSFFSHEISTNSLPIDGEGSEFAAEFMTLVAEQTKGTSKDADALLEFFDELQKLGAEYGYRTASEMLKLMQKLDAFELESDKKESALDVAVMQKLLPKLHGSRSKLVKVLPVLASFCINEKELETAKVLLEKYKSERNLGEEENKKVLLPLAFTKIARMYTNAIENGFANYAEG